MYTFSKWYYEWLVDYDGEPTQKEKDLMEEAWLGREEVMKEQAADEIIALKQYVLELDRELQTGESHAEIQSERNG